MDFVQGKIGLLVPTVTWAEGEQSHINLTEVESWANALPLTYVTSSASEITERLKVLNAQNINTLERYEFLETIAKVTHTICRILEDKYITDTSINAHEKRILATCANDLQTQLCIGYKIVLEQLAPAYYDYRDPVINCALQVLNFSHQLMVRAYQFYDPPTQNLWTERHAIYLFASKNNLLEKHISDYDLVKSPTPYRNISEGYKHSILFSLTNPYRLKNIEMARLDTALLNWLSDIHLTESDVMSDALYVIDLSKDAGPTYQKFIENPFSPDLRQINLNHIIYNFESIIHNVGHQGGQNIVREFGVSKQCLESIVQGWKSFFSRNSERVRADKICQVTFGLSDTHSNLLQEQHVFPVTKHGQASFISVDRLGDEALKDAEIISFADNFVSAHHGDDLYLPCTVLNVSEGGACVRHDDGEVGDLQTGDVIGFKQEGEEWLAGTLQWVNRTGENTTLFGVRFIPGSIQPSIVHSFEPSGSAPRIFSQALVLKDEEQVSVLAPTLPPFPEGVQIRVITPDDDFVAKVVERRNTGGFYRQLILQPIDSSSGNHHNLAQSNGTRVG